MIEMKEWDGFEGRLWKEEINVRQFIQDNYTPYDGDESFLADPTDATNKLWDALQKLQKEERAKGGVLDMETEVVTGIYNLGIGCGTWIGGLVCTHASMGYIGFAGGIMAVIAILYCSFILIPQMKRK
jgi:hypothetical protein